MAQSQQIVHLYDGPAPGSEHWTHQEQESFSESWKTQVVYNVVHPTLTVVAPDPTEANGTAVIICPGGGFHGLSINSEGFDVARWLSAKGVASFVLKYRLVECKTGDPQKDMDAKSRDGEFEAAVTPIVKLAHADGLAAVAHVRRNARTYGIKPDRIGVMGFSAGGTVTASVAFTHDADSQPNFAAPIYLAYHNVIKDRVPDDAAPMFILAATDDSLGFAQHSVQLYSDWIAAGKSAELHLYSTGGHGFGMRTQNLPSDRWIELFGDWLGVLGLLQR